jgi:hypothetical protein
MRMNILRLRREQVDPNDLPRGVESVESHIKFVHLNWRAIAAAAWDGYQRDGRGVVAINSAGSVPGSVGAPWETGHTQGRYISAAQLARFFSQEDNEMRLVREYDPMQEVVVLILRCDGGISCYRVRPGHDLAPPQALEHFGGKLPVVKITPGPQG